MITQGSGAAGKFGWNLKLFTGLMKVVSGWTLVIAVLTFGVHLNRKVNKRTQELIQSDRHQVLNIKGKDRQIQLNSHKKNI